MTAKVIDGKALATRIREEIARDVRDMVAAGHRPPGLGVILVGDDPASATYVRNKGTAAEKAGLHHVQVTMPASATEGEVLAEVDKLNQDAAIHGILVQLPLPEQVDAHTVVRAIDPRKDADGLHPDNVARLAMGDPRIVPCTPAGVMEILRSEGVRLDGAEAVVVGRSILVGRPMAALLQLAHATVTMAHSRTTDLPSVTRRADILVVAVGKPRLVTGEMVKPGATVIDVGMNHLSPEEEGEVRARPVGDCDFESVSQVAAAITPVPGGVGPLTIAMLLRNTVDAARALEGVSA